MKKTWVECPVCGHKLFAYMGSTGIAVIETKCHSCKAIVEVSMHGERVETTVVEKKNNS